MDKYEEESNIDAVVSRTIKNQDMYKDVYLNNTFIDYGDLKKDEEKKEEVSLESNVVKFEEKNYNINDYLKKARENRVKDNLNRSLDNTDCEVNKIKEKEDEISKLIESIEKKEKEMDFFSNLLPDDGDTTTIDPITEPKLENAIDEDVIYNYAISTKEIEETREFRDIVESKSYSKYKKLPLIVFTITFILLIAVVVLILVLV